LALVKLFTNGNSCKVSVTFNFCPVSFTVVQGQDWKKAEFNVISVKPTCAIVDVTLLHCWWFSMHKNISKHYGSLSFCL